MPANFNRAELRLIQPLTRDTLIYENQDSAVVKFDNLMINLLDAAKAPELITPSAVGGAGNDPRTLLTIEVTDANAVVTELEQHGVRLLNGPVDRPWGRRTAAFADPAGNVWDIAGIASFTVTHSPTGADKQAPDSSDTTYACITSLPRVTAALTPALRPRERCVPRTRTSPRCP
ncbi:VOC family protein [Streptomyces sp. NPDC127036]|uniref:VOC family protein n=1 Tax=Streptomyces sp. NPDC127036 TaxID=3347112 RepID=UPI0036506A81